MLTPPEPALSRVVQLKIELYGIDSDNLLLSMTGSTSDVREPAY